MFLTSLCLQAFAELQHKMTDTAQKLKLADLQIDGLKKSKIHTELTIHELKVSCASSVIYYHSVCDQR